MVSMSTIWDRTVETMSERRGAIVPVVAVFFAVPAILPALATFAFGSSIGLLFGAMATIVVLAIVGQLGLTAIGSAAAAIDSTTALRTAVVRLPLTLALFLLAYLGAILLFVPVGIVLGVSGTAIGAFQPGAGLSGITPGSILATALTALLVLAVFVFLFVRVFFLLSAVVINERAGIRSFVRAWELTRGLFWQLLGVALLFLIVYAVASFAVQAVAALAIRLAIGPEHAAGIQLFAALFGAVVTSIYYTIVSVFAAQLYAQRTHMGVADVFA